MIQIFNMEEEDESLFLTVQEIFAVGGLRLTSDTYWGMLASIGGNPTGAATMRFYDADDDESDVEVSFVVLPAFRRQGVATRLVRRVEEYALHECPVLRVVAYCNDLSGPLMRKLGYEKCYEGEWQGYYVKYVNALTDLI